MTRAERSRSRLFDDAGLYAGQTKDLIYEQSHTIGNKNIAGKLVAPTEEEGQFRFEAGEVDFKGVEYVGATNVTLSISSASRYTFASAPAGTQVGDLLVLVVATDTDDIAPTGGWHRIITGSTTGIYTRRVGDNEPDVYDVRYVGDSLSPVPVGINLSLTAWRNADLMRSENTIIDDSSGSDTAPLPPPLAADIPTGSVSLVIAEWDHNASSDATTSTPPARYTEVKDSVAQTGASSCVGLTVARRLVNEVSNPTPAAFTLTNSRDWLTTHLVIVPYTVALKVWDGTPGSENFTVNKYGDALITHINNDLHVLGNIKYKKRMALVALNDDIAVPDADDTQIDTAGTTVPQSILDCDIWDPDEGCFVFDVERDRGIWRVSLNVRWQADGTGARFAEIWGGTSYAGAAPLASSIVRAAGATRATQQHCEYIQIVADNSTLLKLYMNAFQDSGGSINVQGNGTQAETYWSAEYLRDLD